MNNVYFLPLVCLIGGAAGWLFVGRRRFMRRNVAGIEEFCGYGSMVITRFLERIIRFAAGVALLFGFIGMATIPGRLNRHQAAADAGAVVATSVAPSVPAHARTGVLQSSKCYFYDGNHRLVGVQSPANSPRGCMIPSASRV